jgi:hypothetical protein
MIITKENEELIILLLIISLNLIIKLISKQHFIKLFQQSIISYSIFKKFCPKLDFYKNLNNSCYELLKC